MQNLISGYQELSDSLTAIANAHPDQTALVQAINGLNVQIQQAIDQQTQIKNKLDEIAAALPSATADASTLKKELDDLLARGTASVNSVKTSYEQNVKSSLDGLATNLDSTSSSPCEPLRAGRQQCKTNPFCHRICIHRSFHCERSS